MQIDAIPFIIGHRGAAGLAAENTLDSIQAAAKCGVKCIEVDVQLTKDNVPALFHDEFLRPASKLKGAIADYNFADLTNIDFSYPHHNFVGRICSLEKALELAGQHQLIVNLEIKLQNGIDPARIVDTIDNICFKTRMTDRVFYSSFDYLILTLLRSRSNQTGICYLVENPVSRDFYKAQDIGAMAIATEYKMCDSSFIENCHNAKLGAMCYTINDKGKALALQKSGAHSVFTDYPGITNLVL